MRATATAMLKRSLAAALWLITLPALAEHGPLIVYSWPRYIDPSIISEFEQQYDASVELKYFGSDEARDQELAITGGRGYDVIVLNGMQVPTYVRRGWLEPMSDVDVPNKSYVDKRWEEALGESSDYAVANFWGTMGIAFRQDLVPEQLHSWKQLLQPDERLRNRLSMPDYARELLAMALKSDGLSANTADINLLSEAARKLHQQKPFVRNYGFHTLNEAADLVTGKAWAGAFYNGDSVTMQSYNENIRFVIPDEGGLLWTDYLSVAQSAGNKAMAFEFINFLNEPQIAARQAMYANLASPHSGARKLLPKQLLSHPVIYPSRKSLERSEFLETLPPRSQKRINTIGSQLLF